MGFRFACVAVPLHEKDAALSALSFEITEVADDYNESPYSGGIVGQEHFLIWKNTSDINFSKKERNIIDQFNNALILAASETVMSGILVRIEQGKQIWQIIYTGHEDEPCLDTEGSVPDHILELYKNLEVKNKVEADEDFPVDHTYEILSLSFNHYTDFKYDDGHDFKFFKINDLNFKKPFWKFWA